MGDPVGRGTQYVHDISRTCSRCRSPNCQPAGNSRVSPLRERPVRRGGHPHDEVRVLPVSVLPRAGAAAESHSRRRLQSRVVVHLTTKTPRSRHDDATSTTKRRYRDPVAQGFSPALRRRARVGRPSSGASMAIQTMDDRRWPIADYRATAARADAGGVGAGDGSTPVNGTPIGPTGMYTVV